MAVLERTADSYAQPGSRTLRIPVRGRGKPREPDQDVYRGARECRIATFDIPILNLLDTQESFSCSSGGYRNLGGKISPASLFGNEDATVSVDYMARWACRFFGFADCMVPQISFGSAKPNAEGIFKIELPDFSLWIPTLPSRRTVRTLQLILRDAKTYNVVAFLEPESETLAHGAAVVSRISSF